MCVCPPVRPSTTGTMPRWRPGVVLLGTAMRSWVCSGPGSPPAAPVGPTPPRCPSSGLRQAGPQRTPTNSGVNRILLGLPTPCRFPKECGVLHNTQAGAQRPQPSPLQSLPRPSGASGALWPCLPPHIAARAQPHPPSCRAPDFQQGPRTLPPAAAPGRVFPQLPPPGLAAPRPAAPNSRPGPSVASREHSSRTLLGSQLGRPLGTPRAPQPRRRAPGQSSV